MLSKAIMDDFEKWCKENNIAGKQKEAKLKQLEEIFKRASFEPGEAIGVITAQSISEPATQMSIDASENVILKHNEIITIANIGEFADSIIESIGNSAEDDWDVADTSSQNLFVPSITEDEKVKWKRVLAVSRHPAPPYLIKLKTSSGRQIIATDSHSFVIRKSNKIVPVSGSMLKVGDKIPSLKFLPETCIESLEINSFIETSSQAIKPLPKNLKLTEELGWIFGAYLAEGNSTHDYESVPGLSFILKQACGTGPNNKQVPNFAYSAVEKFVSGFLRGYFDVNGDVSIEGKMIAAFSDSKSIIDGIALLLNRFGIFSGKRSGKQFTITIPHEYAKIFKERIGFSIADKSKKLEELCKLVPIERNSQDFLDTISGFGDVLKTTAKKLGYPTRYVNNFTKKQKIRRTILIKYIHIFDNFSKRKGIDISRELSIMKRMAFSDVVWDEIEDISKVKPTSKYVYDLTVDDTETFTTFEGIITHNTMRSYIMATQRDRLSKVTQGLPRLIEIFDARKTYEKNMKIYLKPQYNNKDDAKEIAGRIQAKKVSDIITSDSIDLINMRIELELEKESYRELLEKLLAKVKVEINFRGNRIFIKPQKEDTKALRKFRNKLLKAHIGGIKGIEEVIVVREGNDWMIQTTGTNLKKILQMEEIDIERTTTNDIEQVYEVLGIEAARNVILQEAKATLEEQGLEIDIRHLLLLADIMTVDGNVKAIGRYGVSGAKASFLARANFEETKKHIINAAFNGEKDDLRGVIENVLIGQVVPIGTGVVELGIDIDKMKAAQKN